MNFLLIEDHPIFRFGVRHLISQRWPDAIVTEVGSMAQASKSLQSSRYQLAIVDLNLPDAQGIEAVAKLVDLLPTLPILVLSLNVESAYAQRVLQLGASGYLAKDRATEELIPALEKVLAGGRYMSIQASEYFAAKFLDAKTQQPHELLTAQELRVLLLLADGRRVGEIGQGMNLSPKTVSTYRTRILEKLALTSNTELALYCVRHGLTLSKSA